MRRNAYWLLVVFALVAAACGDDDDGEETASTSTTAAAEEEAEQSGIPEPEGDRNLTIAFPATPGFVDLPLLMTIDELNADGWNIQQEIFSDQGLQTEAIISDRAQFASGNPLAALTAIQQGAPLALVGERSANDWIIVAQEEITSCEDLAGKRVAYQSESSVSTYMLKTYVEDECGVEPSYLILEGSSNRAAALVGGELDASIVQVEDWLIATQGQDTSAYILADIAESLPDLTTSTYVVARPWLEENSELLSAFLAHLLETTREATDDPELLREAALEHLEAVNEDALDPLIETYAEIGLWFEDGGLTEEKVEYSIDFFVETGGLEAGMTVEEAADLEPLQQALEYLGTE